VIEGIAAVGLLHLILSGKAGFGVTGGFTSDGCSA
jgi:hypothetical protein